jgi:oxalate decarboxylase
MVISTALGRFTTDIQTDFPVAGADFLFKVTFMVDDWLAHTPKDIIAKNFGLNTSAFATVPKTDPYILNGTVSNSTDVSGGNGALTGNASYVYRTLSHPSESVPGNGGTFYKIDSTNFPISKTIAATFVTLKPGGLREMHWHPTVRTTHFSTFHV